MTQAERHAHDWTRVDGAEGISAWVCTQCQETCATCGTCGRPSGSSLLLCQSCERKAAKVLDDIEAALEHYCSEPGSLVASPSDMRLAPGGSACGGLEEPEDLIGEMRSWLARWAEHTPGGMRARS